MFFSVSQPSHSLIPPHQGKSGTLREKISDSLASHFLLPPHQGKSGTLREKNFGLPSLTLFITTLSGGKRHARGKKFLTPPASHFLLPPYRRESGTLGAKKRSPLGFSIRLKSILFTYNSCAPAPCLARSCGLRRRTLRSVPAGATSAGPPVARLTGHR